MCAVIASLYTHSHTNHLYTHTQGTKNTVTPPPGTKTTQLGSNGAMKYASCSPCLEGSVAISYAPVATALCLTDGCPTATTISSDSTTCIVPAGSYWNVSTKSVSPCPVDSYCLGGDFQGVGQDIQPCPPPTDTNGETGKSSVSQCLCPDNTVTSGDTCSVIPGYYWDADSNMAKECPVDTYCLVSQSVSK